MSGKAAVIVILVLLLAGGGAAYYFFVMKAGGGALPAEAQSLPGDATMLMGVDVKASMALVRKLMDNNFAGLPLPPDALAEMPKAKAEMEKGLKELEEKTGIRVEQDIDQVIAGGSGFGPGVQPKMVVMVVGRFDRNKVTAAIEKGIKEGGSTPTVKDQAGAKVFVDGDNAAAVVSERVLVFGHPAAVESTISNLSQGTKALNPGLAGLAGRVRAGSTFWLVAGEALMSAAGAQAGQLPFPMPKGFVLSDHPDAGLELVAQMSSADSAKTAASMIDGMLAMAKSQAEQVPALKDLKPEVSASGSEVRIGVKLPSGMGGVGVGVLAAVAIPNLLKARTSANEAATIGDIRTVISAEAAYQGMSGTDEYGELLCLSEPQSCRPDYAGPTFLDPTLTSLADKNGYKRSFFSGEAGSTTGGIKSYAYTAVPLQPGKTGVRSFCGDGSGVICVNDDGSPFDAQGGQCPPGCTPLP
jgi:hypothetical protein